MEREAQAKVVASVWGSRMYSIPCRASCFALVYFEETVEFNSFFQIDRLNSTVFQTDRGKTASAARNTFYPPNRRDDLCLFFDLHSYLCSYSSRRLAGMFCAGGQEGKDVCFGIQLVHIVTAHNSQPNVHMHSSTSAPTDY